MNEQTLLKEITTFDSSYEQEIAMYDNIYYSRDVDLCNYIPRNFNRGNIVKFFQYQLGKPQILQVSNEEFEIPEYRLLPDTVIDNETENNDDAFEPLSTNDSQATPLEDSEYDEFETGAELTATEEPEIESYIIPPMGELNDDNF